VDSFSFLLFTTVHDSVLWWTSCSCSCIWLRRGRFSLLLDCDLDAFFNWTWVCDNFSIRTGTGTDNRCSEHLAFIVWTFVDSSFFFGHFSAIYWFVAYDEKCTICLHIKRSTLHEALVATQGDPLLVRQLHTTKVPARVNLDTFHHFRNYVGEFGVQNVREVIKSGILWHIDFNEIGHGPVWWVPSFDHDKIALIELIKSHTGCLRKNLDRDLLAIENLVPTQFSLIL